MVALSFTGLSLVLVGYIVLSFAFQIIKYRFFHPLAKFPGTFFGSVTRLWITYHNVKGDECETFQKLHKKHGKISTSQGIHLILIQ